MRIVGELELVPQVVVLRGLLSMGDLRVALSGGIRELPECSDETIDLVQRVVVRDTDPR